MRLQIKKVFGFLGKIAIALGLRELSGQKIERTVIIDTILEMVLNEIVERCPEIRPNVVPSLMTNVVLGKFPDMNRDDVLRICIDYCAENNRLTKKLSTN